MNAANETPTIAELASVAGDCFETRPGSETRGGRGYVAVRDDAPEWVTGLVRAAHDNAEMLPDDHRYRMIGEALEVIADAGDDSPSDELADEIAGQTDDYSSDLVAWLGSHASRAGYCDEAAETLGIEGADIMDRIRWGQYVERREVAEQVLEVLRERQIDVSCETGS